ncbi:MAG: hypothetical protein WCO21_00955 [bacterium]
MKKASVIAVFLALFTTSFSLVGAENSTITSVIPEISATSSQPTKWEVLSSMQKNAVSAGTYEATFTEEEINGLIDAGLVSANIKWFIDKASVKISDGFVDIKIHLLRPFRSDVTARGMIVLNNGKASVKISSVYYGFFPAPASFVERLGNFALKKKSPDEWLSVRGAQWESLEFKKGLVSFKLTVPDNK